jgi:hypothetical protein
MSDRVLALLDSLKKLFVPASRPGHTASAIERLIAEAQSREQIYPVEYEIMRLGALPIRADSGWEGDFGLLPSGEVIFVKDDGQQGPCNRDYDTYDWARVALLCAAREHPTLTHLAPPREAWDETCQYCPPDRQLPPPMRCICQGSGWIPTKKPQGN